MIPNPGSLVVIKDPEPSSDLPSYLQDNHPGMPCGSVVIVLSAAYAVYPGSDDPCRYIRMRVIGPERIHVIELTENEYEEVKL